MLKKLNAIWIPLSFTAKELPRQNDITYYIIVPVVYIADSFLSQTIRGLLLPMQTHCLAQTNTCAYTRIAKSRNGEAHRPALSRRIVGDFSPASEKKCLSCLDFFISQWFVIPLSLSNSQSSTNDRHSQSGWGLACSVGRLARALTAIFTFSDTFFREALYSVSASEGLYVGLIWWVLRYRQKKLWST